VNREEALELAIIEAKRFLDRVDELKTLLREKHWTPWGKEAVVRRYSKDFTRALANYRRAKAHKS